MALGRLGVGGGLFWASLALRVAWVGWCWGQSGAGLEFPDERLHWELATNLSRSASLVSDDGRLAARMPLYPLFLAGFAGLGELGILAARLTQALVGAATVWLVFKFAELALDRPGAIVAGLLACLDGYAIVVSNLLLSETVFTFAAVGLTLCAWLAVAQPARRGALVAVALLGPAAILIRESAIGWVLLLWATLWLLEGSRKRSTIRVVACAVVLVGAVLPWALRNRAALGQMVWLSTNGGVTLYDAQGPQADGTSNQEFLQHLPELRSLSEVERDQRLRRLAIEQMRDDPLRVLRLAWVKLLRTWSPTPHAESYRSGWAALGSAVFSLAVFGAAGVGLVRGWRSPAGEPQRRARRALVILVWLPVVYFTLLHCVFIGSVRYRVPLMPFLDLAAACAFVRARGRESPGQPACDALDERQDRDCGPAGRG